MKKAIQEYTILNINGLTFYPMTKGLDSLFDSTQTAHGEYKETKKGIQLYTMSGELFAFIRKPNPMLMSAKRLENKKIWYSYLSTKTEEFLGLDKLNYSEQWELPQKIIDQLK